MDELYTTVLRLTVMYVPTGLMFWLSYNVRTPGEGGEFWPVVLIFAAMAWWFGAHFWTRRW